MKKKMYLPIPEHEVYYGIEVDKKTKLEYENDKVKQRIENLVLYTEQNIETEVFKTHVTTELYLQEGEILLLEESGKGYFRPTIRFGSIKDAKNELKFIEGEMKKVKE